MGYLIIKNVKLNERPTPIILLDVSKILSNADYQNLELEEM